MPTTNIKLFDENKVNIMADEAYQADQQRIQGVQSGIASSQLYNKVTYQASLIAYAIAQLMVQNGLDANDSDAVSTFVNNLSSTMLQKVNDIASTDEAKAGVANNKWMSPALVREAINVLAAKVHVSMNAPTAQDNIAAGFPIGATWIRPNYTLTNLAYNLTVEELTTVACSVVKSEQTFTVSGNGDDNAISVSKTFVTNSGWLYAVVTPDATAVSARVVAGTVVTNLTPGQENIVRLKYDNGYVLVEATYSTATNAASGTIVIDNLTVIDEATTLEQITDGYRDVTDDTVLSAANSSSPFTTFEILSDSWYHIQDGVWRTVGIRPKIVVSVPTGNIVTCYRGDIVLTAESVNRRCVFDVNDYGEWSVTTELPQGVETQVINVTEVKIYNIAFSPKIKNYEMVYDNGDIGSLIPNGFSAYTSTGNGPYCFLQTQNTIPLQNYASVVVDFEVAYNRGLYTTFGIKFGEATGSFVYNVANTGNYLARVPTGSAQNTVLSVGGKVSSGVTVYGPVAKSETTRLVTEKDNEFNAYWYAIAVFKADDWEELATLAGITATSQENLLAQSDALLQNLEAVTYMANVCTGDFMAEAVTNSTFRTALNESELSSVVYANEHWAKFLAMVA